MMMVMMMMMLRVMRLLIMCGDDAGVDYDDTGADCVVGGGDEHAGDDYVVGVTDGGDDWYGDDSGE